MALVAEVAAADKAYALREKVEGRAFGGGRKRFVSEDSSLAGSHSSDEGRKKGVKQNQKKRRREAAKRSGEEA